MNLMLNSKRTGPWANFIIDLKCVPAQPLIVIPWQTIR
jgi:hypothetical protein